MTPGGFCTELCLPYFLSAMIIGFFWSLFECVMGWISLCLLLGRKINLASVWAQHPLTVALPQVSRYLILSQFGFGIVTLEDQQTSGCIPPSPLPSLLTTPQWMSSPWFSWSPFCSSYISWSYGCFVYILLGRTLNWMRLLTFDVCLYSFGLFGFLLPWYLCVWKCTFIWCPP